eukprot:460408-Rhodomonas_salina.7
MLCQGMLHSSPTRPYSMPGADVARSCQAGSEEKRLVLIQSGRVAIRSAEGDKLEVRQVGYLRSASLERYPELSAWCGQAGDVVGVKAFFRQALAEPASH